MNSDHESVTTPLDLRTTTRERGSTGSKTPDYKSRVKDARVSGGFHAHPACTGTSSETGGARKRPADKSTFRLPFRKRPIPVEPDSQTQSPAPPERRARFSPAEDTDLPFRESLPNRLERVADENRIVVAPVTPRRVEEAGQSPYGYHYLHPFGYGKCCWPKCRT